MGSTREIMAMEDFYFTYILMSEKDGNKYTSYTSDLPLRFEACWLNISSLMKRTDF